MPGHVGVSELPVGFLGIIEEFVLTMYGIGHIIVILLGNLLHAQVSYFRYVM